MNIRDQLTVLAEIGRADLKLKDIEGKMAALPHKADDATKKADVQETAEKSLSSAHQILLNKRKELDAALQVERGNLRKWESRAEKIKGEREYSALISEINTQKKAITRIEEDLAANQKELGALEKDLSKATEEAQLLRTLSSEEFEKVRAQLEDIQTQKDALLTQRDALTAQLPVVLAKRYQQIRERRAGYAVAVVAREVCQACKRMLPPEMFIQLMRHEIIETCPSCQRILVPENVTQAQSE